MYCLLIVKQVTRAETLYLLNMSWKSKFLDYSKFECWIEEWNIQENELIWVNKVEKGRILARNEVS